MTATNVLTQVQPAIPYAFRKTELDVTVAFDVYRFDIMVVDAANGSVTSSPQGSLYKVFPSRGENAVTVSSTYPSDPKMVFDILLNEDSLSGGDITDFTVGFGGNGSITSINFQSTGQAAEITADVIDTSFNLLKLGASLALFASTAPLATNEYWESKKLKDAILIKRTVTVADFGAEQREGELYISEIDLTDAADGLIDEYKATLNINSLEKTFGTITIRIKSPAPRTLSRTAEELIGRADASKPVEIEGLPMQLPGTVAVEVRITDKDTGNHFISATARGITMPEYGSYYYIPVKSGSWVDKTVRASFSESGAVKSFTYIQPSGAAELAAVAKASSSSVGEQTTNLLGQIKAKQQEEYSRKLAVATQELEIKKKEVEIDRLRAQVAALTDPDARAELEDELRTAEAELEVEKVKLEIIRAGFEAK